MPEYDSYWKRSTLHGVGLGLGPRLVYLEPVNEVNPDFSTIGYVYWPTKRWVLELSAPLLSLLFDTLHIRTRNVTAQGKPLFKGEGSEEGGREGRREKGGGGGGGGGDRTRFIYDEVVIGPAGSRAMG